MRIDVVVGVSCCLLGACASVPPPNDKQASSAGAIRAAREVGAQDVPVAALHVKLAEEQLEKGKGLMRDGDNENATYVLLRAQSDAELALALAKESKTQSEARTLIDRSRGLMRGQGGPNSVPPAIPDSVK